MVGSHAEVRVFFVEVGIPGLGVLVHFFAGRVWAVEIARIIMDAEVGAHIAVDAEGFTASGVGTHERP